MVLQTHCSESVEMLEAGDDGRACWNREESARGTTRAFDRFKKKYTDFVSINMLRRQIVCDENKGFYNIIVLHKSLSVCF